jgi:UDP-N-acetylglucosamine--N-acetylmuramyl-(pentapeptide) pyrophosphoryl-undecaprenol N-acetylglucosamine transferase
VRVLIAGGGTAGHVHPGLALARALATRGHEAGFIGTEGGVEARLVPAAGFPFHPIPAAPLARTLSPSALKAPVMAWRAAGRARGTVRPTDAVVGMGGYVSVPAVLAGWRERIPVVLHEQNAVPGLANRALSRLARAVALSFADAGPFFTRGPLGRVPLGRRPTPVITGNPVRDEIRRVVAERGGLKEEALVALDLEEARRTVVIFGGSQGALHLDRSAIGTCRILAARKDLQVLLITGPGHLEAMRLALDPGRPDGLLVRLVGYLERMELAYSLADLIVARAGATSLAEITACGLPALLIPYPHATGRHQEANARALERAGGASVMLDHQLSPETLAERVESLIDHEERINAMAARSTAFGRPRAAEDLADLVEAVADEAA